MLQATMGQVERPQPTNCPVALRQGKACFYTLQSSGHTSVVAGKACPPRDPLPASWNSALREPPPLGLGETCLC